MKRHGRSVYFLFAFTLSSPHRACRRIGAVGSGKSSLLSALAGEMRQISGTLVLGQNGIQSANYLTTACECHRKHHLVWNRRQATIPSTCQVVASCALEPDFVTHRLVIAPRLVNAVPHCLEGKKHASVLRELCILTLICCFWIIHYRPSMHTSASTFFSGHLRVGSREVPCFGYASAAYIAKMRQNCLDGRRANCGVWKAS